MPAFILRWEVAGEVQMRHRFTDLAVALSDFREPLKRTGDEVVYPEIKHQFAQQGDPAWPDLDPAYARYKASQVDQPILRWTGALEASLTDKGAAGAVYNLTSEQLELGSDLQTPTGGWSLALIHQNPVTASVPARPMLRLRPDAQNLMVQIFHQWIEQEGRRLGVGL